MTRTQTEIERKQYQQRVKCWLFKECRSKPWNGEVVADRIGSPGFEGEAQLRTDTGLLGKSFAQSKPKFSSQ